MFERRRGIASVEVIEARLEMAEQPGGEEKLMEMLSEEDRISRRAFLEEGIKSTVVSSIIVGSIILDKLFPMRRPGLEALAKQKQKNREERRMYTDKPGAPRR